MKILLVGSCGYIGSALYPHLVDSGFDIDTCDVLARGLPKPVDGKTQYPNWPYSHIFIPKSDLTQYDAVLWFAGCSSVKSSEADPEAALSENVLNLANLRLRMRKDAKLIYASSASVYSLPMGTTKIPVLSDETDLLSTDGLNAYDKTKILFDKMADGFMENTVGLRMGTVCGFSPNLRPELVFNAMCRSAIDSKRVYVANSMTWRSILFLSDLSVLVKNLLLSSNAFYNTKFINAASYTTTMAILANMVAAHFDARIEELPSSPTYSFRIRTTRMMKLIGYDPSAVPFGNRCQEFRESTRKMS